ncbi:MAG: AtpZ/AtpI family protein [Myxococcales bacterium]|nr:AtpZ/AtpI family protein [Myxococcales bacterium]
MASSSTTSPTAATSLATAELVRDKDRPSAFFEAARVSSVGLEMGVSIGIGWGVGYWLDGRYETGPWLMMLGLLFGVAAGFNGLIRTARQVNANAARNAASKVTSIDSEGN